MSDYLLIWLPTRIEPCPQWKHTYVLKTLDYQEKLINSTWDFEGLKELKERNTHNDTSKLPLPSHWYKPLLFHWCLSLLQVTKGTFQLILFPSLPLVRKYMSFLLIHSPPRPQVFWKLALSEKQTKSHSCIFTTHLDEIHQGRAIRAGTAVPSGWTLLLQIKHWASASPLCSGHVWLD